MKLNAAQRFHLTATQHGFVFVDETIQSFATYTRAYITGRRAHPRLTHHHHHDDDDDEEEPNVLVDRAIRCNFEN
jgi:hypothetical protein